MRQLPGLALLPGSVQCLRARAGALKAGGIHDQFTCDFGALTKAAIDLQGLCHGISDKHAKVTGSTNEPGSSAWRLGLAARARSALDGYDEIVADIVGNLEDVDYLVTKLPHLAELHGDQVERLLRWRERLARLSNVLAGHVAESLLQSETLVACKAKVVRVTAKTVGTVRKADDVQSQLGALKTKRAQEAQVRVHYVWTSRLLPGRAATRSRTTCGKHRIAQMPLSCFDRTSSDSG